MGLFDGLFGAKETTQTTTALPPIKLGDYKEAKGARKSWWDTLQRWGSEPGYGAIAPNWNDIWENARGKVARYFGGGPEGPGLDAKVRANAARRGVADQAAGDALLQRSGFQQGNMLQDLAVKQATEEAQFGEQGRKTWLTSLMNLAHLKPSYMSGGTTTTGTSSGGEGWDLLGTLGGAAISGFTGELGGGMGMGSLAALLGDGGGGAGDTGIGDIFGSNEEDWAGVGDMSNLRDIFGL